MEDSTKTVDTTRKFEKSRSYPGFPLGEALTFTETIAKSFTASQVINRDDIAAVLGKSSKSIEREIAAAVQFGLFTREKAGYKLAPIFKQLSYPLNELERAKDLVECFKAPTLFKELIEKYDTHALPDLKPILIRFHGITANAAADAEANFRNSAVFCGVLNDKGILTVNSPSKPNNIQIAEVLEEETPSNVLRLPQPPVINHEDGEGEKVKVRLSGKKYAYLIYPENLTKKDIEILRKEIEKLELIVE